MTVTHFPVRLDFDAHAPTFAKALAHLANASTKELDRVDFDPLLRELVRIRASQLNGCAYCIDMHTKDARAIGETEQRIYGLVAWAGPRISPAASVPRWPSPRRSPGWPIPTSPTRPTGTWRRTSAHRSSPRWS